MRKRLVFVLLLFLLAGPASAQVLEGTQSSIAVPIYAGNPVTKNLLGSVTIDVRVGQVYAVTFEAEIAAYNAKCVTFYGGKMVPACLLWQPMAVTTALFAFAATSAPQSVVAPHGVVAPANAAVIGRAQGRDIAVGEHDYYSPISRTVFYEADHDGPVTIGVYGWGFSSAYASGSVSATVYPGTFSIRAVKVQ